LSETFDFLNQQMEKCSCHAFVITDIMNITIVPELSPDQLKTHNAHQT